MKEELAREIRKEAAYERLGTRHPRCQHCPESDPFALHGGHPHITCYECSARLVGRSLIERHHPASRHNSPATVPIPGNDHRVLSDMQRDWPERTLRNPDGSPLLVAAAAIRGWLDILWLVVQRTVGHVPALLESLDAGLRATYGDRWWEGLDMKGVAL
jgi:hypothetical protein